MILYNLSILRSNLLKQTKLGNETYEPKIMKRDKVKDVLLSFRHNHENDMNIFKMNTFEYV